MRCVIARTIMMVLLLAGITLALPEQGAVARDRSTGVTILVNSDSWHGQRVVNIRHSHRFAGHRVHRFGPRAFHPAQKHSRHAFHGVKRHAAGKSAARAFQRNAAHHAGFHDRTWRRVSRPAFHASQGKGFSGPRVISVSRSEKQRLDRHSVGVLKGSGFHSVTRAPRQAQHDAGGGKLILPSSPHFKHIVVPSHHPVVD